MSKVQEHLLKPLKAIYGTPRWFGDKNALETNLMLWNKIFSRYSEDEMAEGLSNLAREHTKRGFPLPSEVKQYMPKKHFKPKRNVIQWVLDAKEEKAQIKAVEACLKYGDDMVKGKAYEAYRLWHNNNYPGKIKNLQPKGMGSVEHMFSGETWMRMCILRGLEDEVLSEMYGV